MKLRVFTDGGCSMNPGPGGWAAVFNVADGVSYISGYEEMTTNNRMELTAAMKAVKSDKLWDANYDEVEIHSDSAYVVNAVTKGWLDNWKNNGWKTAKGDDVKNADLWLDFWHILRTCKRCEIKITFVKVKGHSGNTFNELADKYAVEAYQKMKK